MYGPHLDRLAASLPVVYHIKGNRDLNLNALAALNERPLMIELKQMLHQSPFYVGYGVEPIKSFAVRSCPETLQYRAEAAERLVTTEKLQSLTFSKLWGKL